MIKYIEKDITTVDRGIIVHGVNCQGVMGSGVAKALRDKYPIIYDEYKNKCCGWKFSPVGLLGQIQVINVEPPEKIQPSLYVVNLFSQEAYGNDGRKYVSYDAIDKGFQSLVTWRFHNEPHLDVYFPLIGAGLGGGKWEVIQAIILNCLDVDNVDGYCCTV